MDTIVTTALVGTGQQGLPDLATGTAIDSLAAQLVDEKVERKVLLMAGAFALYRRAGQIAAPVPALLEPAPPETLDACSPKVAQILTNLLQNGHSNLLPEAYTLLGKVQQRLPFELLPSALAQATQGMCQRMPLLSVLGERGYWLCQFNASWAWVNLLRLETRQILPADFEMLWLEGTLEQRAEVLQRMRKVDPGQGLEWLRAVWKREKVDARAMLLATLIIGLSPADQPFLDHALDDRSEGVRNIAARLLTRLTDSPQALRLQDRADELLNYTGGKLVITLPASIDTAWIHDVAMVKKAEYGNTSKSYWLVQALSRVPPLHWEERFSKTPDQILADLAESEWASEVVNALTEAAILHTNSRWFDPLMKRYARKLENSTANNREVFYYNALLVQLPQQEAENQLRQQLSQRNYSVQSIQQLPIPWSDEFSKDFLRSMKDRYHEMSRDQSVTNYWAPSLDVAAVALAPSCFDLALIGWDFFERDNNYVAYWNTHLEVFLQKIRIRKSLIEEIG